MQSYTTNGLQAYIVFIWVHTSRLSHVDGIPGKAKWLKQESSVQVYAKCSNVRSVIVMVKLFYTGSTFGMDGLHKFKSCESGLHPLSPFKFNKKNRRTKYAV